MKRLPWLLSALSMAVAMMQFGSAAAQERPFCDDNEPNALCSDDTIRVVFPVFGAENESIFEYAEFVQNGRIDSTVVIDAASVDENGAGTIQGWSYAVRHDDAALRILPDTVTTDGTDVDLIFDGGFKATGAVEGGFFSGVVLSFTSPAVLPAGRNVVAKASYELLEDVGVDGTMLTLVSSEIGPPGSPPTDINITIGGRGFLPRILADGVIRRAAVSAEDCENGVDDDGDGLVDLDDPDCHDCPCPGGPGTCLDFALYFGGNDTTSDVELGAQNSFTISSRNVRGLLGFQFGVEVRPEDGGFAYTFSDDLGTDNDRLVETIFTDVEGASINPVIANRLTADTGTVSSISRGAALAGFSDGDFLEYDIEPGVGGPGFFVGYVSDLDGAANIIPPTGPDEGNGCPLNELLVVELGRAECPGFAYYFGNQVTTGTVDARGMSTFVLSSRNAVPLLGFQVGVRAEASDDGVVFRIVDDLGTDADRLVEPIMTDIMGASITPATPNELLASSGTLLDVERGAALQDFAAGDFFNADLDPGVGGPGFFVGYVSDLDGAANVIPATDDAECNELNELLVVTIDIGGGGECPNYGFAFEDATLPEIILDGNQFSIGSHNVQPLLGFQLGVAIDEENGSFRYRFTSDIGTDDERPVELLMTTNTGDSITPDAINTLLAQVGTVRTIERGAALQPFAGGDFLDFDLEPGMGGPGFFVGYVSDLDDNANQIPATEGEDCALNELLVVHVGGDVFVCPENGFGFGVDGMVDEVGLVEIGDGSRFSIGGRSTSPLFGFQLGVSIRPEGEAFRYEFSGELGTDAERPVELLMTATDGTSLEATGANALLANTGTVTAVSRGDALAGFAGGDFLAAELEPGLNGPGFFVGYVSDLDGSDNVIPAPTGPDCAFVDLLEVTLEGGGNQPFIRGDANGNGHYDISDAVIIIQTIILNFAPRFDCPDLLDVNDDEVLMVDDALPLLMYLFQAGPELREPFLVCGQDPTPGALDCFQSNCPANAP